MKKQIAEKKSLCDFAILGVVHQTNADDILPMAKAGAIGYKIFLGETIGNLPFPDDGMCQVVFSNITKSGVPLCVHAENRQILSTSGQTNSKARAKTIRSFGIVSPVALRSRIGRAHHVSSRDVRHQASHSACLHGSKQSEC